MATDARLSVGLVSHPKTKKLIRRLGTDGAWRLVCLFLWCAANRSDGDLTGLSDEDIELAVDFDGEEGTFVAALREVGFLDGDEFSSSIHDWEEHNPWAAGAEARSEKARWAALCKQHGRNEAARMMPEYASRIGAASQQDAKGSTAQATSKPEAQLSSASSTLDAVPESASSTPLAESSSAPSPSPSPSPSPITTLSGKPDRVPPDKPKEVLAHLNLTAGRSYRHVDTNLKMIAARMQEGASVDDCKAVIDSKVAQWADDKKMREYLRPATLFNRTNFEQYLGQVGDDDSGVDDHFARAI